VTPNNKSRQRNVMMPRTH